MPKFQGYWYVLFVRTGSEERLVEALKARLSDATPFVLQRTCVLRRQGQKSLFQKLCFPGYVFVETDKPPHSFIEECVPVINKVNGVYRLLNYSGDRNDVAVREDERVVLSRLFGDSHCLDVPTVFKEGDTVKVISGALMGYESKIVRFGRYEVVVAIEMLGKTIEVSLGVDVVKRVDKVTV